jgi:perosamine synthetase
MDAIQSICRDHSILLIEDCAEAFGSRWKGRHVGSFGDAATFSFFGNKTITTGEGGMVLASDPAILQKCRHLKSQGVSSVREYWHDVLAYNYRMTNIEAAIGLAQIELAEQFLKRKAALAALYKEKLSGLPLRTHDAVGDVVHSHWMCSIVLNDASKRDGLRAILKQAEIETRPFFTPAHRMPHSFGIGDFPRAESLSARGINLPSFPDISEEEIAIVCQTIRDFF